MKLKGKIALVTGTSGGIGAVDRHRGRPIWNEPRQRRMSWKWRRTSRSSPNASPP